MIKIFLVMGNKEIRWLLRDHQLENSRIFNNEEVTLTDKRKAYEEKRDAQLKEWNAETELLKAKEENAKDDVKTAFHEAAAKCK